MGTSLRRASGQQQAPSASSNRPVEQTGEQSNSEAAGSLPSAEPSHSLLSAVPGGEGLHAGGCGCASCLGGGFVGVHPGFTHVLADGTVTRDVGGGPPADGDAPDTSGAEAPPSFAAPAADTAESGSVRAGRHPQFPQVYGQTYYSEADLPSFPRLSFEFGRTWTLGHTCKPKATSWGEPSFPALATPENMSEGYLVEQPHPKYPDYAHYVLVGSTAATNIAMAEEQHVNDLYLGWNITANRVGDAINALAAGSAFEADSAEAAKAACVEALVGQLGTLGEAIRDKLSSGGQIHMAGYMNNAFTQSKKQRDGSGNHSFGLVLYTAHDDQKKVASMVDEGKSLDGTASSAVVNYGTIL